MERSAVLVDLRSKHAFEEKHLAQAAHIPLEELVKRMYELPPPGEWPLILFGDDAQCRVAMHILTSRGWCPHILSTDDPKVWDEKSCETGSSSLLASRPNAFLQAVCEAVEFTTESYGVALDVGCGSGRDAVFLDQHFRRCGLTWDVVGVDNHLNALDRARRLASDHGCNGTRFILSDLRKDGMTTTLESIGDAPLRFVHGCRYMDAPLLDQLRTLIAPGGIIVWSTFMDPPDDSSRICGARMGRRLRRGQLRELFGEEAGFEVLHECEAQLLTRGKWVPAQFWASRRAY